MNKILFIATSDIFHQKGGSIANRALLKSLENCYPGEIDVIHPFVEGDVPANFHLVPEFTAKKKLVSLFLGRIHKYNPWVLDFVDRHKDEYSHCFINCGIFGDLINGLHRRGLKVCTIHHNYEVEFQMDNKSMPTFCGRISYFVKRNERMSYRDSDLNLFLTYSDCETFRHVYGDISNGNNKVIGIFEEIDYSFHELQNRKLQSDKFVICGSLNSVQTLRGIEHFAKNCLPALHEFYNDQFSLLITGRSPHECICQLAAKDNKIQLIPSPENMSETIGGSSIFICPTNVGGGIKLRIMDGLKLGMPIITHKISARGYDAFWNMPWFQIYDDRDSFVQALRNICNIVNGNPNLRREIMDKFKKKFSFTNGSLRFISSITEFLAN